MVPAGAGMWCPSETQKRWFRSRRTWVYGRQIYSLMGSLTNLQLGVAPCTINRSGLVDCVGKIERPSTISQTYSTVCVLYILPLNSVILGSMQRQVEPQVSKSLL